MFEYVKRTEQNFVESMHAYIESTFSSYDSPIDEDFKADNNIFNFIKLFRYALTADLLDFPSI
jgi:hypothetical protein